MLAGCPLNMDEILSDFKTFYYDVALTTSEPTLAALLEFADHKKILFGSDYPYAPLETSSLVTRLREALLVKLGYPMALSSLIQDINHDNAARLFGLPTIAEERKLDVE